MAGDKRTILSGKRARSRRKKALRALRTQEESLESLKHNVNTVRAAAHVLDVPREPEHDEGSQPQALYEVDLGSYPAVCEPENNNASDDEQEIVFVCRPALEGFCTEFVTRADRQRQNQPSASPHQRFTARIPAFREAHEGYITYTIVISVCSSPARHFQLERRYSEFVALASALERYLKASNDPLADMQWQLPPKTWFRLTHASALEERRSQLEASLDALLAADDGRICRVPLIRDFLMLDLFGAQVLEEKQQGLKY